MVILTTSYGLNTGYGLIKTVDIYAHVMILTVCGVLDRCI